MLAALKAQLPLDNNAIDRFRTDTEAWKTWDTDGSGSIEYKEIMDEDKGLLKYHTVAESRSGRADLRLGRGQSRSEMDFHFLSLF